MGERSNVGKTKVFGPVNGPTDDVKITYTITDLQPGTTYCPWDLCGSPDNGAHCTCVGPSAKPNGGDSEGFTTAPQHTLAERWDGSGWPAQATPTVAGEHGATLSGVLCPSSTVCTAVGGYDVEQLRAVRWNGTSWALHARGARTAATPALRWNGSSWSFQSTPSSPGGVSKLCGVWCPLATACTAVGF